MTMRRSSNDGRISGRLGTARDGGPGPAHGSLSIATLLVMLPACSLVDQQVKRQNEERERRRAEIQARNASSAPSTASPKKEPPPRNAIKLMGGGASSLVTVTRTPEDELSPALSPDGQTLLVTRLVRDASGQLAQSVVVGVKPSGLSGMTVFTSDSSRNADPAWLPDGSGFVFQTDRTGRRLLVRSLAASPQAGIAFLTGTNPVGDSDQSPHVSPDGKRLAFSTVAGGVAQVVTIRLDGSNMNMLTTGSDPRWSPDGRKLAFVRSDERGNSAVYLVDPDTGGGLVQVTSDLVATYPTWSPDGSRILFVGRPMSRPGERPATTDLYSIKPDGSDLQQLSSSGCLITMPRWERDGNIYFAANCDKQWDIWRASAPQESSPTAGP